jgi:4'-phosphopantetheinyl transferase
VERRIVAKCDMQLIADHYFCCEEASKLMSLPSDQREHAFFLCWTRKEAYLKAIGKGLSMSLKSVQVTLRPEERAAFVRVRERLNAAANWVLHNLDIAPNYAAALAYAGTPCRIHISATIEPAELLQLVKLAD